MTNQLALPADALKQVIYTIGTAFGTDIADAIKKNPEFFTSTLKEALTQEVVKKHTLKGVFAKFQKGGLLGGLFGRGGLFSYLNQSLFKKSSIGLTPGIPLGKYLEASNESAPLTPQTPLQPAIDKKENKTDKEFLKGVDQAQPIPILFTGFSDTGSQQITDLFSSLFKTLVKDIIKGIGGIMPESEEDYGEGLIPTIMDSLSPLLFGLPVIGSLLRKILPGGKSRMSLGQGKKGAARRSAARRAGRGFQGPRGGTPRGTPPVKPTIPPIPANAAAKTATTAGKTGTTGASRAVTSGISKGASRGLGRSLSRSAGRAIPGLGTALTVGFLASDLSSVAEQEARGEITQKEAYEQKGGAWGSAGGALAGAATGAAIGAAFGGVGAIPGAIIGGLAGSLLGGAGGEAIGGAMAPKDLDEQPAITPAPDVKDLDIPEPKDYTQTLNNISNNTGTTADKIARLSDAIFTLAGVFKGQGTNQSTNNIFLNGGQQQATSASQLADANIDAIGHIRRQFAV